MRDLLIALVMPPTPFVLFSLAGALLRRGWMVVLGSLAVYASTIPLTGQLMLIPLGASVPAPTALAIEEAQAIVVPTAGVFADASGRWWPAPHSVLRATRALEIQRQTGLPLLLTGGAPDTDGPPESEAVMRALGLEAAVGDGRVLLDREALDTFENGRNAARLLVGAGLNRVILVTSRTHLARAAASLRAAGLRVVAGVPARAYEAGRSWKELLPSASGIEINRAVAHEVMGLAWYLASGRIGVADIDPGD